MKRRVFLGALALFPALPALADLPDDRAQAALRRGEAVVYVRHGATTHSGVDRIEWPRERQRLLSQRGEAQARDLGLAFRRQGWPVGQVLSSPFARCHDMAMIAFGKTEDDPLLLGLLSDDQGTAERRDYSRFLVARPTSGGNRVIVGHSSNIREATGESLPEGGAVVVLPGSGVLAVLSPEDIAALA